MGILDNLNTKKNRNCNSTKGFYFGATEAEGENNGELNLTNYFGDYLEILDNLEVGRFIFTGRKGVGKSAIAKYIKDKSDTSTDSFAIILRFSDFELEKIIQTSDCQIEFERLFFEWLILVNLVKLIIKNQSAQYTQEYSKLQRFLDSNSGLINIDKREVKEIKKNEGGEVNFGVLTNSFGGVFKRYFGVTTTKAPFVKMLAPLKEIIQIILNYEVNKNIEFWILFDDLDIHFKSESISDNSRVIELIRLARNYNNEIFKGTKARIIVFLRDDMKQSILSKSPESDPAKIFSSYEIQIKWYKHDLFLENENSIALKRMVNRRIKLNFEKFNIKFNEIDPWNSLFKVDNYSDNGYSFKSSFKYIADFTFYRPRDYITFLSLIGDEDYNFPIDKNSLNRLLKKYIGLNIKEIKSELSLFFNEDEKDLLFQKVFYFLFENSNVRYNELEKFINTLNFNKTSGNVIEILLDYSLIIYRDSISGKLFFNYRESPELERIGKGNLFFTLPKCIYHYYKKIQ